MAADMRWADTTHTRQSIYGMIIRLIITILRHIRFLSLSTRSMEDSASLLWVAKIYHTVYSIY